MILLSKDQLASILPQRPPFVMIDALVADDSVSTETSFEILPSNILTHNGKATAALLVENIVIISQLWLCVLGFVSCGPRPSKNHCIRYGDANAG